MGQQLRSRIKRHRRERWIDRKKKAAHLAAKTKPKTAPAAAAATKVAAHAPATAAVPPAAGVTAKA